MSTFDPRVDAYIDRAKPFAQPILQHLRASVHRAAPDVEETMKWSRPFFVYRGIILGNISAFKEHCAFGLWGSEMAGSLRADGVDSSQGMGTFGRIAGLNDLPAKATLERYIRQAARLIDEGVRTRSIQRVAKARPAPVEVPEALTSALGKNKAAAKRFDAMSPSCRREYAEWIASAKQDATRERRVAQAMEWIAEGKQRNWKYQNC